MCGTFGISPRARLPTSPPSIEIASTSISTPSGAQTGSATSSYRSTSGGPVW
jgi:hypothetical protein